MSSGAATTTACSPNAHPTGSSPQPNREWGPQLGRSAGSRGAGQEATGAADLAVLLDPLLESEPPEDVLLDEPLDDVEDVDELDEADVSDFEPALSPELPDRESVR